MHRSHRLFIYVKASGDVLAGSNPVDRNNFRKKPVPQSHSAASWDRGVGSPLSLLVFKNFICSSAVLHLLLRLLLNLPPKVRCGEARYPCLLPHSSDSVNINMQVSLPCVISVGCPTLTHCLLLTLYRRSLRANAFHIEAAHCQAPRFSRLWLH